MRFPYLRIGKEAFAPIIKVELWEGARWIGCEAYVDSGASHNLFHSEVAKLLGIKLTAGRKLNLKIGGKIPVTVYVHKLKMRVAGKVFDGLIGFSNQLCVAFNLLGRNNFFRKFKVGFDEEKKILTATFIS